MNFRGEFNDAPNFIFGRLNNIFGYLLIHFENSNDPSSV